MKVMADINRVIKPGGTLVISSPNPNYYWENALNIFYHYFKKRVVKSKHEEHFYDFSRYNMRTVAMRAGFDVVRERGFGFFLVKTPVRFNPVRFPGRSPRCGRLAVPGGTSPMSSPQRWFYMTCCRRQRTGLCLRSRRCGRRRRAQA
jgi:SAM-dependent methyltransferase